MIVFTVIMLGFGVELAAMWAKRRYPAVRDFIRRNQ